MDPLEVVLLGDPDASVVIDATIGGLRVSACGDQGSSVTLMGEGLAQRVAPDAVRIQLPRPVHLRTGMGQVAEVSEAIHLTFELDGHVFRHDVLIAPGYGTLFLLGIDFFMAQ